MMCGIIFYKKKNTSYFQKDLDKLQNVWKSNLLYYALYDNLCDFN